ncbi:hypothetical protein Tco_1492591 [Tanacetum coccineum]
MANLSSVDPVYDESGPSYDSNILSEDNAVSFVQSNVSSVPNDEYMMIFNDMHETHAQPISVTTQNIVVANSLTAELAIYKEQVELYERRARFELTKREQKIDEQLRIKENKYLEEFLDMKALKEKNKVAIGYKNPLCLTRAKQVQPALYNGYEIIKNNHAPAIVHNTEDTLEIAEITRRKMNDKMKDPEYLIKMKAEALKNQTTASRSIKALTMYPPNTPVTLVPRVLPTMSQVKINIFTLIQLFLEFEKTCKKRITPTGLTEGERGFEQTKECYLKEVIPFFKTLKEHFEGIQKALTKEIKEMKDVFEELEAEVDQNVVDRKHDEIEQKNLLIAHDNLIADCLSKEVFYVATNSELNVSRFTKMHDAHTIVEARCLELEAELSNLRDKIQNDNHNELVKRFSNLEVNHLNLQLKYQNLKESFGNNPSTPARDTPDFDSAFVIGKMKASLQGKDNVINKLKTQISHLQETRSEADRTLDFRALDFQITQLTEKVTVLQEQNELFRAENAKIKQHYKELYDSIKITRAKHIEQTTALTTENENLKAQIQTKMKSVTKDHVKPTVLAPGKYAIDVEPIPPRNRNNREVHLDYLRHLKESVETLREIVEEAKNSLYRRHCVVMISFLVTPRVSALAGCDRLVSEPLVIENSLISLNRGSFDVIVGMDWLSKRKFVIVCYEKVVRIPLEGDEILRVHGERTQGVVKTLLNTKVDELKLSDISIEEEHGVHLKLVLDFLRKEKLYAKVTMVDALSRKERVKPRRVRAMAMTIQYGVRGMKLAAQNEAFKQKNVSLVGSEMDEAHASGYLIGHLKPFGCQVTILNTSDHLGIGHEWYFDLDYLTDSLGYTHFKTNKPAGTQETNINAGTQDHDSDSEVDEQVIVVPSFPSNSFAGPLGYTRFKTDTPAGTQETNINAGTQDTDSDSEVDEQVIVVPSFPSNSFAGPSSSNGPSVMERNADYAEELAKLQRQEYEAKDAAARYGYLFSQETAEIISQAEAEIRNHGVSADMDPAGIASAGSDPAGGNPAGSSQSAGSDPAGGNPAGSSQPAGSDEPAGKGNPAVSTSVSADFIVPRVQLPPFAKTYDPFPRRNLKHNFISNLKFHRLTL